MNGTFKDACPPTKTARLFLDARDLALSLVLAAEKEEVAGKRFLIFANPVCNQQFVEIIDKNFPQFRDKLPTGAALERGAFSAGAPDFDNSPSVEGLGMTYRSMEESIVDVVKSLLVRKILVEPKYLD